MEAYGDGYMAPEEEWEREGLLDPAWEKQQKKVSERYRCRVRDFTLFPSRHIFFSRFPPLVLSCKWNENSVYQNRTERSNYSSALIRTARESLARTTGRRVASKIKFCITRRHLKSFVLAVSLRSCGYF